MSSYYKATRPDGTDFYTGTVDYGAALASGDTIRLDSDETEFPGPGWLHLATVPTECDGMTWPCRLFTSLEHWSRIALAWVEAQ